MGGLAEECLIADFRRFDIQNFLGLKTAFLRVEGRSGIALLLTTDMNSALAVVAEAAEILGVDPAACCTIE